MGRLLTGGSGHGTGAYPLSPSQTARPIQKPPEAAAPERTTNDAEQFSGPRLKLVCYGFTAAESAFHHQEYG